MRYIVGEAEVALFKNAGGFILVVDWTLTETKLSPLTSLCLEEGASTTEMKFYRYLYVGNGISSADKLKAKLNMHMGLVGIYIIVLADGDNQLEIINASNLKLPFYNKKPIAVVGLAKGFDEAVDLVIQMTNDSIKKMGNPNVKNYLIKKAKTRDFTLEE